MFRGDEFAMTQARLQLREEFLKNKHITDAKELAELQKGIEEADEMLRFSIVQGRLNDRGNYEVNGDTESFKVQASSDSFLR